MIISNVDTSIASREPRGRLAFWSICFLALAAFCLSLVLLTACGQSNANSNSSQSNSVGQEVDDLGSGNAGFVVEDTAVVNVEIDE